MSLASPNLVSHKRIVIVISLPFPLVEAMSTTCLVQAKRPSTAELARELGVAESGVSADSGVVREEGITEAGDLFPAHV